MQALINEMLYLPELNIISVSLCLIWFCMGYLVANKYGLISVEYFVCLSLASLSGYTFHLLGLF